MTDRNTSRYRNGIASVLCGFGLFPSLRSLPASESSAGTPAFSLRCASSSFVSWLFKLVNQGLLLRNDGAVHGPAFSFRSLSAFSGPIAPCPAVHAGQELPELGGSLVENVPLWNWAMENPGMWMGFPLLPRNSGFLRIALEPARKSLSAVITSCSRQTCFPRGDSPRS